MADIAGIETIKATKVTIFFSVGRRRFIIDDFFGLFRTNWIKKWNLRKNEVTARNRITYDLGFEAFE